MRKFTENELVIATHNAGKVREIAALLSPYIDHFVSSGDLGIDAPEETGTTFLENSKIKALASAASSGKIALADDSGFAVAALDGQPGVYSADWAELPDGSRDFLMAMGKVHDALLAIPEDQRITSAAFICVLTLAWPDGHTESFEGRVEGDVTFDPRGDKGFGYDPIFIPKGHDLTFAEMEPQEKHRISHRADAFKKLVSACFESVL